MNRGRKIFISIIDFGMLAFCITAFYIYMTPPGLHYLVILYSAFGILILNSIRLLFLKKQNRNSIIPFLPYLTVVLISFNSLFATEQYVMARVLTGISLLINIFVGIDLWQSNNIGRITINRIIKYFSVDMEAKGWVPKEKNNGSV